MIERIVVYFLAFLVTFSIPLASEVYAHSLFNSAEEFIGGYRVQIATLPEFPQIDEESQILIRVTDKDFNEINGFTMGMRFNYQGEQIQAISPQSIEGSHWEMNYVFQYSGNHIIYVDLYDMKGQGEILTYTFNIGTQSPFGYIFFIAITIGASMFAIVIGYIYIPKRISKFRP